MRRFLLGLGLVAGLVSAPIIAPAQVLASSSFTTGMDGWVLADFYAPGFLLPNSFMFWRAIGGDPGGYIGTTDDARAPSSLEAFLAPASFLGNQSAAFGGSLTFSIRGNIAPLDAGSFPMAMISDGTTMLQFRAPYPVAGPWTQYAIPLFATPGWEVATSSANYSVPGAPATNAQLLAVLGNLSFLSIQEDLRGGQDMTDLDEVVLSARTTTTPETATLWLFASGLVAIGGLARSRRSQA